MGINDRDYSRRPTGRLGSHGWSVNTWIIVVNVAIFALMAISPPINQLFGNVGYFSTSKVLWMKDPTTGAASGLEFWRFLTFQFLHAGPLHVAMNMFGLYVFGGMVEDFLGGKKYLAFYLTCGVFGGLMYLLLNAAGWTLDSMHIAVPPFLFKDPNVPLVGASAGVFGVIMACAYIAPNLQVQLLFPPVPIRIRTLAYVYVGIALVTVVFGGHNAGGEASHLGGAAAGFFFIRNSHLLRDFFDVFRDSRKAGGGGGRGSGRAKVQVRPGGPARKDAGDVDRILDKVRAQGIQSLTSAEKAVLARDTESRRSQG